MLRAFPRPWGPQYKQGGTHREEPGIDWETYKTIGNQGGAGSKEPAYSKGDPGLIPGSGRSSGEGHGNPLQYSCLENLIDRGAWQTTVHEVSKSWTGLSD